MVDFQGIIPVVMVVVVVVVEDIPPMMEELRIDANINHPRMGGDIYSGSNPSYIPLKLKAHVCVDVPFPV